MTDNNVPSHPHPDPVGFLREWRKPVVMSFLDYNGNELEVVLAKKNLIKQIIDDKLSVVFRTGSVLRVYVWKAKPE